MTHRTSWGQIVVLLFILTATAYPTRAYVEMWRSDLTIWQHAATVSPQKPRVLVNYGLALMRDGHLDEAQRVFLLAQTAAAQPWVPSWDRQDTIQATARNLTVIALLRARVIE